MKLDASRFEVRLAQSQDDVAGAQRLRYRVFVEEMGAPAPGADHENRLEKDAYDAYFDHLLLIDKECESQDPLDCFVGVYRLMRGSVAKTGIGFYGASEYDLTKIMQDGRESLELGRSCVAPEYRGGVGMHLLWDALGAYVTERNIEILFGVASFHGSDVEPLKQPLSYLYQNHLAPPDLRVKARAPGAVDMNLLPPEQIDRKKAMAGIPSLIKAYLRLGGFVGDGAYVDKDFNTVDVCLLMDTKRMSEKYRAFYSRSRGTSE